MGIPGFIGLLVAANAAAWAWAGALFADKPALLGTALLAWVFGLRHAVDADHIVAIDNVVRKLLQEGGRPLTVGFFFALGHSSVVFLASAVIAATATLFLDHMSGWKAAGGLIGTAISAGFLLLIAAANFAILAEVWRSLRRVARGGAFDDGGVARGGAFDDGGFDTPLAGGGPLARLFRPLFRAISRSWHMYPLGFLFGLGFDTATEVGLLGLSAEQAARDLSPWAMLVFPALFTAGMVLVDTADGMLMVGAYGWAFVHPIRKLWYNLTITAASVAVAILIGGLEVLGLAAGRLGLEGGFWSTILALNRNPSQFGFAVIGVFLLSWAVSALVYRLHGYERLILSNIQQTQRRVPVDGPEEG